MAGRTTIRTRQYFGISSFRPTTATVEAGTTSALNGSVALGDSFSSARQRWAKLSAAVSTLSFCARQAEAVRPTAKAKPMHHIARIRHSSRFFALRLPMRHLARMPTALFRAPSA
ncbi:hypothetical protein JZU48_01625 [bacterium]|nr:hypothetical protein [bacterium]